MSKSVRIYFQKIKQLFEAHSVPDQIAPMESYMKNHFRFYGIRSPQRKTILRDFIKQHPIPEGEDLKEFALMMWADPHREMQYSAMEMLDKKSRKMDASFIGFYEKLILEKSWWDSVDWLAPNGCGKLFLKFPDQRLSFTDRWNASDNIWLQRSSILFQLKYRHETDFELLKKYILNHADSKEFFIQKASGWALRQYGKYNPNAVIKFINEHKDELSNLTVREGMKHLK